MAAPTFNAQQLNANIDPTLFVPQAQWLGTPGFAAFATPTIQPQLQPTMQPPYSPQDYAMAQQIAMQNMMQQMYMQYLNHYSSGGNG